MARETMGRERRGAKGGKNPCKIGLPRVGIYVLEQAGKIRPDKIGVIPNIGLGPTCQPSREEEVAAPALSW